MICRQQSVYPNRYAAKSNILQLGCVLSLICNKTDSLKHIDIWSMPASVRTEQALPEFSIPAAFAKYARKIPYLPH